MSSNFPAYVQLAPKRFRERYGLDYQDFAPGQVFHHRPGLTISQQDNTHETLDTLNQAMLHFDVQYAAHTEFGQPLGVSTLTVKRLVGMTWKTFQRRKRILGFSEIAMTAPVFGGDTLYAHSEVLRVDLPSPDPQCGVVEVRLTGTNQRGEQVCRMVCQMLIYRAEYLPLAEREY